jgi:hypothetical protein
MKWFAIPLAIFIVATAVRATDEPPSDGRKTVRAELIFPRFSGGSTAIDVGGELRDREQYPNVRKALEGVPTLKIEGLLFQYSFRKGEGFEWVGGLTILVSFAPAKADLGDLVKAVAGVQGPEDRKKQPAAILMIRTDPQKGLSEDQHQSLWKHLSKVKGLKVEESRQLKQDVITGVVLDEAGGARLEAITAAIEKSGGKVRVP